MIATLTILEKFKNDINTTEAMCIDRLAAVNNKGISK